MTNEKKFDKLRDLLLELGVLIKSAKQAYSVERVACNRLTQLDGTRKAEEEAVRADLVAEPARLDARLSNAISDMDGACNAEDAFLASSALGRAQYDWLSANLFREDLGQSIRRKARETSKLAAALSDDAYVVEHKGLLVLAYLSGIEANRACQLIERFESERKNLAEERLALMLRIAEKNKWIGKMLRMNAKASV